MFAKVEKVIAKTAIIIFWVMFAILMLGPMIQAFSAEKGYSWKQTLNAIRVVETGGSPNDGIGAVGDGGKALGPYQIWKAYWIDANINCHRKYSEVLNDKELSEKVVYRYMKRYQSKALQRLLSGNGTIYDVERVSRTHNGGPKGFFRKATLPYFLKVKTALLVP